MKKGRLLALLLAGILILLSACGPFGGKEKETKSSGSPTISPDIVGSWTTSFQDGGFEDPETGEWIRSFTIAEDGTLTINGKSYQPESTDKDGWVTYHDNIYAVRKDDHQGSPENAVEFRVGTETFAAWVSSDLMNTVVPAEFVGDWVLPVEMMEHILLDPYANEFFDFSIDENGSLYVNGFQYPLDKEKTLSFKDKNYYYFGLESDFVITPNEDVTTNSKCPWILWIGDVNSGKYGLCVNGVKKTQLTPDNWMDFFEFVLDYQFQKTASGDLQGLCSNVMLKPVDGVDILYVSDGMARVTFNNPQWGFVRLDLVNESAHIDIMTQEEYEKYSYLFASLSFPTDSGVHEFTYNSDEKEYTCLLLSLIEDEMQHEGENLVAIDVLYSIEQDLDSIGGTVYYK